VDLYRAYSAIKCKLCITQLKKENYRFIRKKITSKPITSNSSLVIQIRLQFELFFLNECLYGFVLLKSDVVGIRLKKIASIGVWGNGRLPQLNLPSVVAEARASVWIFICLLKCF
jgi:hypothetical protein